MRFNDFVVTIFSFFERCIVTIIYVCSEKIHPPLAPACIVCLIRNDLTTIWCEVTSSIHIRNCNDEDYDLGIIDLIPKVEMDTQEEKPNWEEKEMLLCFRPILKA